MLWVRIGDHIAACFVYVTCVCHAGKLIASFCGTNCARTLLRRLPVHVWRALLSCCWRGQQAPKGIIDTAIEDELAQIRLAHCRKVIHVLSYFIGAILLTKAIQTQTGGSDDSDKSDCWITLFGGGAFYIGMLLVDSGCVVLTRRRLDALCTFMSCLFIINTATMTNDWRFFALSGIRFILRLSLGMAWLERSGFTLFNVLYSAVACWRYDHNSHMLTMEVPHQKIYFIVLEVAICVMVSWAFSVVQQWLEARIRLQMVAQSQKHAMGKQAAYHCNALCWLAPDLRLSAPAPDLAYMLFMGDAPNQLAGKPFANYIFDHSDEDRFREFIASSTTSPEAEGLPARFDVSLRDATDRAVPVAVFHSCFVDEGDRIGHLLGINERANYADEGRPVDQPAGDLLGTSQAATPTPSMTPRILEAQAPAAESMQSSANAASAQPSNTQERAEGNPGLGSSRPQGRAPVGGGSFATVDGALENSRPVPPYGSGKAHESPSLVPLIPEERAIAPVSVVFDAVTDEILACTVGFTNLTGPLLANSSIQDMLVKPDEFEAWMQDAAYALASASGAEVEPLDLQLVPPTMRRQRQFRIHATALMPQVRTNVSAADMGVEPREIRNDGARGLVCVLELRDIDVRERGQERREAVTRTGETSADVRTSDPSVQIVCM